MSQNCIFRVALLQNGATVGRFLPALFVDNVYCSTFISGEIYGLVDSIRQLSTSSRPGVRDSYLPKVGHERHEWECHLVIDSLIGRHHSHASENRTI